MSNYTIDTELFDRQTRTFGENSAKKFSETKVGVYGLSQSLGSEVVKNLAISGFRHFYLFDNDMIDHDDISYGMFYSDSSLKQKRSDVIKQKILELNPTSIVTTDSSNYDIDVMVMLNQPFSFVKSFEKDFKGKLILGYQTGMNGFIFVNPKKHVTDNINGENISSHNISSIEYDDNDDMLITTITKHMLSDNDHIRFNQLNANIVLDDSYKVKTISPYKFSIKVDNPHDINFINGSIMMERQTVIFDSYKSFSDSIIEPLFEGFDWDSSQRVVDSYKSISKLTDYQFMPVASVIGSIVSNEVIKLASDRFTPINQFLTFEDNTLEKMDYTDIVSKLASLNYCMVGCGAIGCELLKNMAMIGCGSDGNLNVTDPDHIEKSNLSRQFLFRNQHVGKSKSMVAAEMVKDFICGHDINVTSHEKKITSEDPEFTNKFFKDCDIIFNALDNMSARKYVDSLAFKYNLPLFESGTMGMKGNTQPVIPFLTETYSDSTDAPDEDNFPVCTIKNFPNMIQHTIHWARDNFEMFNRAPTNVMMYLKDPYYLDRLDGNEKHIAINDINMFGDNFKDIKSCVEYAFNQWHKEYNHNIKQLLHSFPSDKLLEDGTLFWSHGKKCPKVLEFDSNSTYHRNYIISMTRILANICGIKSDITDDDIINITNDLNVPSFKIDVNKKEASNDDELKEMSVDYVEVKLNSENVFSNNYYPQEFEKDDNTNYHVMFLTSSSNCRAENYSIPPADFNTTKGIAGKIIPAVATTTSLVAGLIVIEMVKFVSGIRKLDDYRSYFVNLAINTFIPGEPMPAKKITVADKELNAWTKFEQTDDITLGMFLEKWSKTLSTDVNMVFSGSKIIYSEYTDSDKSMKLSEIIKNSFDINPFDCTEEWLISSDEYEDLPSINIKLVENKSIQMTV